MSEFEVFNGDSAFKEFEAYFEPVEWRKITGWCTEPDIVAARTELFTGVSEEFGIDVMHAPHALGYMDGLQILKQAIDSGIDGAPDVVERLAFERASRFVAGSKLTVGTLLYPVFEMSRTGGTSAAELDEPGWASLVDRVKYVLSDFPRLRTEHTVGMLGSEMGAAQIFGLVIGIISTFDEIQAADPSYLEGDELARKVAANHCRILLMHVIQMSLPRTAVDEILSF